MNESATKSWGGQECRCIRYGYPGHMPDPDNPGEYIECPVCRETGIATEVGDAHGEIAGAGRMSGDDNRDKLADRVRRKGWPGLAEDLRAGLDTKEAKRRLEDIGEGDSDAWEAIHDHEVGRFPA